MGKTLAQINILHARLDGFTDNYGDESYNQQLSLKRANTVADALSEGDPTHESYNARNGRKSSDC